MGFRGMEKISEFCHNTGGICVRLLMVFTEKEKSRFRRGGSFLLM